MDNTSRIEAKNTPNMTIYNLYLFGREGKCIYYRVRLYVRCINIAYSYTVMRYCDNYFVFLVACCLVISFY